MQVCFKHGRCGFSWGGLGGLLVSRGAQVKVWRFRKWTVRVTWDLDGGNVCEVPCKVWTVAGKDVHRWAWVRGGSPHCVVSHQVSYAHVWRIWLHEWCQCSMDTSL